MPQHSIEPTSSAKFMRQYNISQLCGFKLRDRQPFGVYSFQMYSYVGWGS